MTTSTPSVNSDAAARAFEMAATQAFHSIMITENDTHDGGHKVVFVNQAFTDMTGFTPEEVVGKTPRVLQGANTDQKVIDELRDKLQHGNDFHGKTINYRKDGSEFMIEWKVFPIRDDKGSITHHVAVQRDISS